VDIRQDNQALLHLTQEKTEQKKPLLFVPLESSKAICCFVLGLPKSAPAKVKVNNEEPLLTSDGDEDTFQFVGIYKQEDVASVPPIAANRLGFGLMGMLSAKAIGKRTYEVAMAEKPGTVIVRHCLGSEGVNFKLFHSLNEKKPFASYYFSLGYDVKPNCGL
jgi:hypothetical protein